MLLHLHNLFRIGPLPVNLTSVTLMLHCSLFLQQSHGKSRSPLTGVIFEVMVGVALAEKQHFSVLFFLPCREEEYCFFRSALFFSFHSPFQKQENHGLSASGWQNIVLHKLLRRSELNLNFMKSYLPALNSKVKKT